MNVLFVTYRYWPYVGGVEKYVHRLGRALQELGHAFRVITAAHEHGLPEREVYDGVEIYRFPGHRSPARAWLHLMRMQPVFRWADVIHISNTHVLEYFYRMVAWTIPDKPIFLTRHGMSYKYPVPASEKARAHRSLALVDGVVHDGCFIGTRLGVTPDIVPDQGLCPEADELPDIPEPPPTSAVFVGRLDPDSGIQIYVDTIRVLKTCFALHISLDVYGGGTLEDPLRSQVEREQLPVTFHGWQEGAQERITDGCFAFVAGRMAIQEAMARRRLVVAAFIDPLKRDYVCGEPFSPYLIAGGDAETIAETVAHYATHNDDRRRLVARAYNHTRQLSWKRTAAAYLDLWGQPAPEATARRRMSRAARVRLALQLRTEALAAERRERIARLPSPVPAMPGA